MVIQNLIVGIDKHGKELRCGDICNFQLRVTGRRKDVIKNMKGVIVYDEDSYAFAFATLDESAPILLMHAVEYGSIEYEVSIQGNAFIERCNNGGLRKSIYCNEEEAARWHGLYISLYDSQF